VGTLWLKIKVWTKVTLFALLTVYVLTFIFKNIGPKVDLWVWYFTPPLNLSVLLLALVSFLIGVLGTILSRTTFKTIRQLRNLAERTRGERLEREMSEMRTKAAMLRSRASTDPDAAAPAAETELP
jgi:uncharacterized integral membrane protein